MNFRATTLGGAALAGVLLLAGPALAQSNYYNTNPTPEERAQTNQLNSNAADQAQRDADSNASANADFQAKQNAYDRDRADYDAKRAAYDRARERYEADRYVRYGYYGHRWDAFYGYTRFHDVDRMRSGELLGLRVSTRGGGQVGRIRDVDTNGYGRVTRVLVSVGYDRTAWIDADDLRFDPVTRVVMTNLSRDQIDDMARMRYPRF
jgi:hypothetical protein